MRGGYFLPEGFATGEAFCCDANPGAVIASQARTTAARQREDGDAFETQESNMTGGGYCRSLRAVNEAASMYAQGGSNYIGLLAIRSARSYGWQLREITAGFPSK